jgi:nitrogen-specific signal transduction histidine kinase
MLETVQLPLLVLDGGLRVVRANAAFFRHFKVTAQDFAGQRLAELGNGQWEIPDLLHLLENMLHQGEAVEGYRIGCCQSNANQSPECPEAKAFRPQARATRSRPPSDSA